MTNRQKIEVPSKAATLLATTLAAFLTPFTESSINIALPQISSELRMDDILLSWVPTAYILTAVMLLVPIGRFADIYGKKMIFRSGIITYTVASILLTIASSSPMLIAFRVLQGIGGAMTFSTSVAILTSVFPHNERGKVLGINVAAVYIGLSIGPVLGGILTEYFGWRSVFLINVPLGLIVISVAFWKLKGEWAEAKGEKFDFTGSIIYSLSLMAVVYGFTLLPQSTGGWLILAGILGLVAFTWWETRVESPILHTSLFQHNTVFVFSNLAALINYSATFAVGFLLSFYLQFIKGLGPQNAGLVLISAPAVQAMLSPLAGRLSDRVEPRVLASLGMGLTAIGLLMLTFLSSETSLWIIITSLIIMGGGFGLFSSPNTNAIMSSVKMKFYGVTAATLGTMRQVGMALSIGTAMLLFSLFIGRVQITPEYYPGLLRSVHTAFIIFTILCVGGIFASLARGKVR